MKVKDCMCANVYYVKPNSTVGECAKIMSNNHIGFIPVCNDSNQIVGIITDRDLILRSLACDKDAQTKVSDVMTCNICSCSPEIEISEAEKIMSDNQIRRLPVIENNKIVGILSLGDLATNKNIDTNTVCNTLENICGCNKKNAE